MTETKDDIAITPKMLAAGEAKLWQLEHLVGSATLVAEVYREMERFREGKGLVRLPNPVDKAT